jgi:hypothetical protein
MYPDVIYIGAPRAGSTWIWKNLRQHPDAWTLPYKAVEYLNNKGRLRRRKTLVNNKKDIFRLKHPKEHLWDLYYLFYPFVNEAWYKNLFKPGKDKLKIDMVPSCLKQSEAGIQSIYDRIPNAKLLIALRNPIDRTWSHSKHHYINNKKRALEEISNEEFMRFFNQPNQFKNGCYVDMIEKWQSVYPADQIFIYFFEDILLRPEALLEEICQFLGIKFHSDYFKETLLTPENYTGHRSIPDELYNYLLKMYQDEIVKAQQKWGGYTLDWVKSKAPNL